MGNQGLGTYFKAEQKYITVKQKLCVITARARLTMGVELDVSQALLALDTLKVLLVESQSHGLYQL
jgi:hypothetical protein